MPRYPQPGTILLGKYRVLSLIGEGGMGAVLKARHIDLDDDVAIKCLLPHHLERDDIVRRFLREAKAAVKLKGKHVARVLDVGRLETGVPYIVMEYLEGADLNAIVKHHGAQDPAVAVDLMLQACEAIAEAHSIGIIHRDIKASNFFVSQPENQAPHLKVLDFGIATAPEGTSNLTNTQSVLGTPSYMAPEQMRSSKTSDARSDIWSLGVVLYELLEGARPFRSEVYSDLCLKVGMDPPLPITNPNVPEALVGVVMHCLEKPVEKRYQSIAELAFDLMPFASDPVFARAYVEQTARLLGRRSYGASSTYDIPQHDRSDAHGQFTPANLTPAPSVPTLLGRPTPMPSKEPKTPTSIQASNGQLSPPSAVDQPTPRRRGAVIGIVAASIVAIGAIAVFAVDRSTSSHDVVPATEPVKAETPKSEPVLGEEPTKDVEPAKVEPTKVEPTKVEPAKVEATKVEPAKVEATKVEAAKVEPKKVEPKKVEPKKVEPKKVEPKKVVVKIPVKQTVKNPPKKDPKKDPTKPPEDGDIYGKRE